MNGKRPLFAPAAMLVLLSACSSDRVDELLPISGPATLSYEVVFAGLGTDVFTLHYDIMPTAGVIEVQTRVEGGKEREAEAKTRTYDVYGRDDQDGRFSFFLAAKAPIFMSTWARKVGEKFDGFRVKQALEWNGHSALEVAGRDNWTWYYDQGTGLFVGGDFSIGAGSIRMKLVGSEGFGDS